MARVGSVHAGAVAPAADGTAGSEPSGWSQAVHAAASDADSLDFNAPGAYRNDAVSDGTSGNACPRRSSSTCRGAGSEHRPSTARGAGAERSAATAIAAYTFENSRAAGAFAGAVAGAATDCSVRAADCGEAARSGADGFDATRPSCHAFKG